MPAAADFTPDCRDPLFDAACEGYLTAALYRDAVSTFPVPTCPRTKGPDDEEAAHAEAEADAHAEGAEKA